MKPSVTFCIALHNHQPVGNFGHVFEMAFDRSYAPFLDVFENHPSIRISLHTSGPLLDWMEENRPQYLKRLRRFVEDGRVEILGGGYYEPILTIIPRRDAAEQIRVMSDYVQKRFGARPRGIWLTERIWEPSLPELLNDNGVDYTLLDESHFRSAGILPDGMIGHYVSEKLGRAVHIFPIRKDLRYAIPFAEPTKTIEILKRLAEVAPGTCVTYGDDGEKFGLWPNTYNWVYERRWLERFFQELAANVDWLKLSTLSEAMDTIPATGRAYLPATSYHEMTQWSLPTEAGCDLERISETLKKEGRWDEYERFIRGGFWDNFLVKYPEANRLHKRMLRVSDKIEACPADSAHTALARRELMMGQCNCAYWHGLFGGLYLNYLRDAVTRHLSRAEGYTDLMLHGGAAAARVETVDFDRDGRAEAVLENPFFRAVVAPSDGGTLHDLVLVRKDFDIANVMTRRPEIYHERVHQASTNNGSGIQSAHDIIIAKEEGLAELLTYDRYTRVSFRDRVGDALPVAAELRADMHAEWTGTADASFDLVVVQGNPSVEARMSGVWSTAERTLQVFKRLSMRSDSPELAMEYHIVNERDEEARFAWGVEWNLTLLATAADDRWLVVNGLKYKPDSVIDTDASSLALVDGWQDFSLTVDFDGKARLRVYPIETVSQSESGFERTYQGTCLVAHRELKLAPRAEVRFRLSIRLADGVKG